MPEEELEPLEEEPEFELELESELVELPAVGVADEELNVLDEPAELVAVDEVEPDVEPVPEEELLVCVALGTVAARASEPAIPLAATIAVIVAVRALPCRTDRAAPAASMAQLRPGKLSFRDP